MEDCVRLFSLHIFEVCAKRRSSSSPCRKGRRSKQKRKKTRESNFIGTPHHHVESPKTSQQEQATTFQSGAVVNVYLSVSFYLEVLEVLAVLYSVCVSYVIRANKLEIE